MDAVQLNHDIYWILFVHPFWLWTQLLQPFLCPRFSDFYMGPRKESCIHQQVEFSGQEGKQEERRHGVAYMWFITMHSTYAQGLSVRFPAPLLAVVGSWARTQYHWASVSPWFTKVMF